VGELTFARGRLALGRLAPCSRCHGRARRRRPRFSGRAWLRFGILRRGPSGTASASARVRQRCVQRRASSYGGRRGGPADVSAGRLIGSTWAAGKQKRFPRANWAPACADEGRGPRHHRPVGAERVLNRVWNELASNQLPFMQRSLAGVADGYFRSSRARQLRTAAARRAHDTSRRRWRRGPRCPRSWLRTGLTTDHEPFTFALASVEATSPWRHAFAERPGVRPTRPTTPCQPERGSGRERTRSAGHALAHVQGDLGARGHAGVTTSARARASFARCNCSATHEQAPGSSSRWPMPSSPSAPASRESFARGAVGGQPPRPTHNAGQRSAGSGTRDRAFGPDAQSEQLTRPAPDTP